MISEKDLTDVTFNGLQSHLREKLEGHNLISLSKLQQNISVQENQRKNIEETPRPYRHNVVTYDSYSSDDKSSDVLTVEFNWLSKAKSYSCESLKPVRKNRQDHIRFTFDVAKCNRISNGLHKGGYIKISHIYHRLMN